jgi:hypothetical protein
MAIAFFRRCSFAPPYPTPLDCLRCGDNYHSGGKKLIKYNNVSEMFVTHSLTHSLIRHNSMEKVTQLQAKVTQL